MHPFVRKLRHGARLTGEDKDALVALAKTARFVGSHRDILIEGTEPRWLPLIVEGWACRYKMLENGKRQIISLFVPGDLCEPFGVLPRFVDYPFGTLTPVTFCPLPLEAIGQAAASSHGIREALWWDLLITSGTERERIVGLGRRSATERTGHLFCEMYMRLKMVDLVQDMEFDFPLTQNDLADLLGLSAVHTNRSLQELRKLGLISLHGRRLKILNFDELRELSFFDDAYFHIDGDVSG